MIDLKKLKSNAEYLEKTCDGAYVEIPTADVLELISLLEQAQKDATRYQWLRGKNNSSLVVADYHDGCLLFSGELDSEIDAAMQSEKGE